MLNKTQKPSENDIIKFIGNRSKLWAGIHNYVRNNYNFTPELVFTTKTDGWAVRYRRSGRTLAYFYPEYGAFTALIILGAKEVAKVEMVKDKLNKNVKTVFDSTKQLHDGRWLWIRVLDKSDVDSIILLINAKKKPRNE